MTEQYPNDENSTPDAPQTDGAAMEVPTEEWLSGVLTDLTLDPWNTATVETVARKLDDMDIRAVANDGGKCPIAVYVKKRIADAFPEFWEHGDCDVTVSTRTKLHYHLDPVRECQYVTVDNPLLVANFVAVVDNLRV